MDESNTYFAQLKEAAEHTFWGYLGCVLDRIDERQVVVSLTILPHHLNLLGILHGGVHATLIDSAMGIAAMAARPNESVVTTNLNMHYVAPVSEGKITVTANLMHMSRKMITTQGEVRTEDGELCAFGTGTFRIIEKK